jgi:hypothetical protein
MTETSPAYPTNPPRFRKAPGAPAESLNAGRCETCEHYSNWGLCVKHQLPVEKDELCDNCSSVLKDKRRQWAEP